MIKLVAKAYRKFRGVTGGAIGRWYLRACGVRYGRGLSVLGLPILSVAPRSAIVIGDRVVLCSRSSDTALGVKQQVVLRTLRAGAELRIGDDVGLSGAVICAAARVEIGAECLLGANVMIVDTDFHPLAAEGRRYNHHPDCIGTAEVVLESNVFVGANSIILKGVRIGENSVIGAGSVVARDVPANSIAAGNPCRVIRPLKPQRSGEA
jgi:acetyltransferase-like isoleucine patch superfamily enzyme